MTGDKAWLRWKVYERWFKQKQAQTTQTAQVDGFIDAKIIIHLDRTKKFIFERCDGEPTREKYETFLSTNIFLGWIAADKISKYHTCLSPFFANHLEDIAKKCRFDVNLLQSKMGKGTRDYFKEEFSYEFGF